MYQDFSDNTRLAEGFEDENQKPSGDNDQGELQDEKREGIVQRVIALPYTVRRYHVRCITNDCIFRFIPHRCH